MAMEHRKSIEGVATTNIVLAAVVFFAPFFTGDGGGVFASNLVSGVLVAALAGYNIYAATQRHTERAYAPAIINILVGLWVLASGYVYGATMALTATNAAMGALIAVLASYNTWAAHDARAAHPTT